MYFELCKLVHDAPCNARLLCTHLVYNSGCAYLVSTSNCPFFIFFGCVTLLVPVLHDENRQWAISSSLVTHHQEENLLIQVREGLGRLHVEANLGTVHCEANLSESISDLSVKVGCICHFGRPCPLPSCILMNREGTGGVKWAAGTGFQGGRYSPLLESLAYFCIASWIVKLLL